MPLALQTFPSVKDAKAALASTGTRYLGGGTLVVRAANEGDLTFSTYVRSTDPSLSSVEVSGRKARIGASVTMAEIARHPDLSALAAAARGVGGPAIRNMATVGGNLFAPAPYGDFAVALLALGAAVAVDGNDIPVDAFLQDRDGAYARTVVSSVGIDLPAPEAFRFRKVSRIKPKGISVLSIAALLERGGDGIVRSARIALGCMADRPIRAKAAEKALVGKALTEEGIAGAVAVIGEGTAPITDPIASAWYRGEVLPVHFARLLLS